MAHPPTTMKIVFVLAVLFSSLVACLPHTRRYDIPWNITADTYDYVVVGCGISGLVVATRLSEDPNVSVICIEAGSLDQHENMIEIPVFIGEQPPDFYAYNLVTVAQSQLDNHTRILPMGRGVGGGSLINGMIWNRGNQEDFDLWAELGNPGWDWDSLLPYFQRSETYTPRTYSNLTYQHASFDPAIHGSSGPVQVSYPAYCWPQMDAWFTALNTLGVPTCADPNSGTSAGVYFLPVSLDPTTQTRSDARCTYHDAAADRPNYHILTNTQIVRVVFDNGTITNSTPNARPDIPLAVGVELLGGRIVYARREVILAAGAIHTPQILELSGIGDANVLSSLDVPVVVDLPGVGNNLQDHALLRLEYPYQSPTPNPSWLLTNSTFNATAGTEYFSSRTGPWTSKPSTAVAFPSLAQITNASYALDMISTTANATQEQNYYYPSTYYTESESTNDTTPSILRAGYEAQINLVLRNLQSNNTPAYEILNDNSGGLDIAVMRPLSRGATHIIDGRDASVAPAVDPRWLSHPFDFEVMILAMQFNQRILDTPSISALKPEYSYNDDNDNIPSTSTGSSSACLSANATRQQLETVLRRGVNTEYHYSGTCAMMPMSLGGVVDSALRVYGIQGLRIVDTSVYPVVPGAHLQAVAYAVAERAADIIRGRSLAGTSEG
ncbi:hypothetical protein LTR47_001491 [Exophiala xenobiotica]|nr:hypothetical protein LTR47_001491 [Exophiala xenobiotica]KAK5243733.1 hypothetical protein LTS06_010569 [Exophiala xenobiotica]KAK5259801.1 hypothetical protein LTR40_005305 [Exophiala xenobiotica]KAK5354896.1 hypothetical protein LTR61_002196 [Exophiala xenobiotica]KAK5381520.1 hypothetical protein LTR11_003005 [Exophiala xenobiotica]